MDAVEDIKQRLSIEDVVADYVQLKRSGRNFKGLSPWTNEKSASLMVSPEKQIWHDFSSGKGGDMFTFVQETEGVDFKGALELLARKAGIDLDRYKTAGSGGQGKIKERLYEASELAAKFYQVQFSRSRIAIEYVFKQRKFTKQTALDFRLGYSPNTGRALVSYLTKKGFTADELKKAGLATTRREGLSDMFRERLMVPLSDAQGRVVGFTARQLAEDDPGAASSPKYINTPATAIYDKGRQVFGLHLAKNDMRKLGFAVVVEGNLDVLASHQAGIKNVVATAGTAMTESHLKTIGRFTHDVRLAFDADDAGQAATERAIPLAQKTDVNLSIIAIAGAKDPDELIKSNPGRWREAITEPHYAVDWLIDRYAHQLDLSTALGKRQFSDVVMRTVSRLKDQVEQDHYIGVLSRQIGVSPDALRSKLHSSEPNRRLKQAKQQPATEEKEVVEQQKTQDHFISLMLMQPVLRDNLTGMRPDLFSTDKAREVAAFLLEQPTYQHTGQLPEALKAFADYGKILVFQFEELYQNLEETELHYEAARLKVRLIEQYVKTKKAHLSAAMHTAQNDDLQSLLEQARQLDELLKTTRI